MLCNEIGSEYWDIPINQSLKANFYPLNAQWYLSGGSALDAIIQDIKKTINFRSVAIPSWCCASMVLPFIRRGVQINFYSIKKTDTGLLADYSEARFSDVLFVMDYFGFRQNSRELQKTQQIIIRDLTHSMFSYKYDDSDYYFASLRKWSGFFGGGVAWAKNKKELPFFLKNGKVDKYVDLRKRAMSMKGQYIRGLSKEKEYLKLFSQAEELLEDGLYGPSCVEDVERVKEIDYVSLIKKRRDNGGFLIDSLRELSIFKELNKLDCPLFVPIVLSNKTVRDELRNRLIKNRIYCPVHWPKTKFQSLKKEDLYLYDCSLSLVCDQRYDLTDMAREAEVVLDFISEGV